MQSRPFAIGMERVFQSVASRTDSSRHPLLAERVAGDKILLVIITADRGLCGSFNSNVVKAASPAAGIQEYRRCPTVPLLGTSHLRVDLFDVRL